ncbi:phosphatase PAP2 family protein [Aeromicrobium sp. 50.2.37]|uniref:phosphatase PAP2 family protein n=1 Tax=Aeromicrobium sp. 50.2.37 TaxID=2969305 RepID=UPI0021503D2D|nr:phosphatase PAP2 family protein [Aeromicrobium sp. 50.2.37]MCR4513238.1 phosphatase PAP2 family protein [Aeromicrobium sp. 50.2.37]
MALTEPDPTTVPTPQRPDRGSSVRGPAALVAVAAVVLGGVLAWFVLLTPLGQRLDERAMNTVVAGRETQLQVLSVLGYVSIGAIGLVSIVCVALALSRGRAALAIGALTIIAGANVTTQVLKRLLLERADLVDGVVASNSFPSGHTTVIASGVGALCLVSPRWMRPLVVPVGAFAVALTGASTVVAGWHRPSDVVGAVLVTTAWTAAVSVLLGSDHERVPGTWLLALVGSIGAIVALVAIGVRPSYGWDGFTDAALVLGALGVALGLGVAAANRVTPTS